MTKRRESREQAFTLLFEKTVTGDSMEDIIEMAKEARDVVIDPYCEKLTALFRRDRPHDRRKSARLEFAPSF